jgi:hypothetical protein
MGCLPASGLGGVLRAPHRIYLPGYETFTRTSEMRLTGQGNLLMRHTGARQLLFRLMMLIYWVNAYCSTNKNT